MAVKIVPQSKVLAALGAYAANDVLSESAAAGTVWKFSNVVPKNGGGGYVSGANAVYSKSGGCTNITPRLVLYLFKNAPTSNLNDNVANTAILHADVSNRINKVEFPAMTCSGTAGTASSESIATPSTSGNLPIAFCCDPDDSALYGIVVTLDAESNQTAGATLSISLTIDPEE